MKRIIATAMTLALAVGLASAAEVTSGNIVGYKTMTLNPGYSMLSLNWVEVSTANDEIGINDLFSNAEEGSQLKAELSANKDFADQILVWNAVNQQYDTFYYRKTTATILGWANYVGNATTTVKIPTGVGFWFLRNGTTSASLTFAAQVNAATLQSHVFEASNYTQFGSGYSANMPFNDARWDWAGDGALAQLSANKDYADQILVWNGATEQYDTYYYRKTTATILGWANYVGNATTTVSLPIGTGAWYLRNGTSAITADEVKPY